MVALFRRLLRLYPAGFCREFSDEMTLCFRLRLEDVRHHTLARRGAFAAREFWGAFIGAMSAQLGGGFDGLFRRFDMPSFRFSRISIVFMILALAGVLFAIDSAMDQFHPGNTGVRAGSAFRVVGYLAVIAMILGAIGYGVLRAANRSAGQRLENIHTWPQERQTPRR